MVEPFLTTGIPTDTILYKEVTGVGITTFAYKHFKSNLICCLPNRPVIEDKVAKHNLNCKPNEIILGVHKGITIEDITDYLENDLITHKKILTTPEGFIDKVVPAFGDARSQMLNEYYCLIDECERIISDISYRGKIAAPIDLFFEFKHKAMVSATVLPFSDPRFEGFKKLIIEPDFDYSKRLTLIETNNVVEALKKRLAELNSDHVLIFLNSTDTIYAIASRLGIVEQSHAYCSKDSAMKLFVKKFKNADDELDVSTLVKYNFLTSRFFSAFDIEVPYKPDVIMVTDVYSARHSILDPQTEVIQIAGRCRNGVNSLTHITNFDSSINSKTKDEALTYLDGCFDTYQAFIEYEKKAINQGARDMLRMAIEESMAHSFYSKGELNNFMIDNYVNEERVKGYYQQIDNLQAAYALRNRHFIVTNKSDLYLLSDEDRRRMDSGKTAKEVRRETAQQLHRLTSRLDSFSTANLDLKNYVRGLDKRLTAAFDVIGLAGLEQTNYVYSKMDKAVVSFKKLADARQIESAVHKAFESNTRPLESDVIRIIDEIRAANGQTGKTRATMINRFFEARRSSSRRQPIWVLSEKRYPSSPNYKLD